MCTLDALKNADYPMEQLNLLQLFYTIINQKNLNLNITDDNDNNIFDLIFKYARNTDLNMAKNLFTLGENLLTLINNQQILKKILFKKKSKPTLIKKHKNFMQYIFPNIKEELLFEPEIEYLQKLQPRIINILANIFQFKLRLCELLQDPINHYSLIETPFILPSNGITLSWHSWLNIIQNSKLVPIKKHKQLIGQSIYTVSFNKNDLIHNSIIEDVLNIYKANNQNDQLLLTKLEDYICTNKSNIDYNIAKQPGDLLLKNILALIDKYKKYLIFLDNNACYRLGNEYDKNKN